ncbi:MAG TPA: PIN domain-containing protein [Frankiaceae bacterium]|nr:PIN domain-containing protein [Frankiaceae bacterium]
MTARYVLDAGVLIAAARGRSEPWAWQTGPGRSAIVPAAVLAQVWRRPPSGNLARFLKGVAVEELTEDAAREAGELLGRAGTADVVDASVVVVARRYGADVVTADTGDVGRLVAAPRAEVRVRRL